MVSCVLPQGTAQVSLADCEGAAEMVYHWLRLQMLSGAESQRPEQKSLSHRRHHDNQEEEQRPRTTLQDVACSPLQRPDRRDEPGEATSER